MKKSVIVVIGIIYVLAIVVVSFFGLKIETFNEIIYIEKIECTNEEMKMGKDGIGYIVVNYVEDLENPTSVQLKWHVYPDDASRKSVDFVYDETRTVGTVNEFGTVIFNKKGTITVYITATDGSSKSAAVKVIAK